MNDSDSDLKPSLQHSRRLHGPNGRTGLRALLRRVLLWLKVCDRKLHLSWQHRKTYSPQDLSQSSFDNILNTLEDVIWSASPAQNKLTYLNAAAKRMQILLQVHPLIPPNLWIEAVHPDDRPAVAASSQQLSQTGHRDLEYRVVLPNGSCRWLRDRAYLINSEDSFQSRIDGITTDITKRKQAEERYRSIFENAIEGIFQSTPDGNYLSANPALAKLYGYASADDLLSNLTNIEQQLYVDPGQRVKLNQLLQRRGSVSNFEYQVQRRDGTIIWISENVHVVRDKDNHILYYEGTVEDVTERKRTEDQLFYNAFYDSLTGLPNRKLFMDRLNRARLHAIRRPDTTFAVLFIDLDRFKVMNDSLGHLVGDKFLIQVGRQIQTCIRAGDTVARFGGDEFAVLLEEISGLSEAIHVAERVQENLNQPFYLQGQEVFTSASIGITLSRNQVTGQPYQNLEDLMRDADIAMYQAKHQGKARYEVFDSTMHRNVVTQLQLETDLRRALTRKELRLHYQPIVMIDSGEISGFEALIRWQHPDNGLIPPAQFIPIAEETGLIVPIGDWVLQEACWQMQQWRSQHLVTEGAMMSVNVAGRQFVHPALIDRIRQILTEQELPSHWLHLEITEGVIMENLEVVTDKLTQLQALGVQLGIDDFGTGYSSLSRLQTFPINTLKIDRSFVGELGNGKENWSIIRTILSLSESLNMRTIAEGIETAEQLAELKILGCRYGQGYLFSRPMDSDAATTLMQRRKFNLLT